MKRTRTRSQTKWSTRSCQVRDQEDKRGLWKTCFRVTRQSWWFQKESCSKRWNQSFPSPSSRRFLGCYTRDIQGFWRWRCWPETLCTGMAWTKISKGWSGIARHAKRWLRCQRRTFYTCGQLRRWYERG